MLVGQNLRLDMARPVEEAFEETFAAAEGGFCLAHGRFVEIGHLLHLPGDLQAAAAAAMGCLDRHRQAVLFGKGDNFGCGFDRAVATGNQRGADAGGDPPRLQLVAEGLDDMRIRADPDQAAIENGTGKFGPLGQETITRMHGIGAGTLGDADQLFDVEIGFRRPAAGKPIGLVGQLDEQRVYVGIGIDCNRANAVVAAGADDADGDFATIGNQHFFHRVYPRCRWSAGIAISGLNGLDIGEGHHGPETDFCIDRDLPGEIEMIFGDGADHWITAGQRMVGKE